jgi:2-C-methyl-D-erythritol 4-phosphate cytidylyltransferase
MKDTAAIIVAGGQGLRFGGNVRKQYLTLRGRPLFSWSIAAFQRAPSVADIVLVLPHADHMRVKVPSPIRVVAGGQTRADSVRAGLAALGSGIRWVAVHDAVRPLVKPELIEKVIAAARKWKAAIAAIPSPDTVKLANGDGCIHSTPPREKVWLAQTPQVFERKLLARAHAKGMSLTVTDDAQLVERLGVRVRLVESPPENIKITRPIDLELAQCLASG